MGRIIFIAHGLLNFKNRIDAHFILFILHILFEFPL